MNFFHAAKRQPDSTGLDARRALQVCLPKLESVHNAHQRNTSDRRTLDVRLEPPGGMSITLHPTLLEVVPNHTLRWLGRLVLPGIFDGEHHFMLVSLGANRTRFVQQERFTGLLVPAFASSLDKHTLAGFQAMNAALKTRATSAPAQRAATAVA